MARFGDAEGRFSILGYEQPSISDGIESELRKTVGQVVRWMEFDPACTERDPVYAVGSDTGGRQWGRAVSIPAYAALVFQGQTPHHERGFWNVDTLRASFDARVLQRYLPDILADPDSHLKDRIMFRGALFTPFAINLRGVLRNVYTTITVEANEVTSGEAVNDRVFTENEEDYHPIGDQDDLYVADFAHQVPEQPDSFRKTTDPW